MTSYVISSFSYVFSDLIILKAITPIHAGVGRAGGVVDLPIQRDEYGYPCIYSSSIKGALKTALLHAFMKTLSDYEKARKAVQALLGPEPEEGETFESSIAILDAYLLTIPTRSLKGVYAYITSPLLLKRFYERLELLASSLEKKEDIKRFQGVLEALKKIAEEEPGSSQAICLGKDVECNGLLVSTQKGEREGKVVLAEEFFLDRKPEREEELMKDERIKNFLKNVLKLDRPLLILSDDVAKKIIDRSIVRYTRVRLGRGTKTVEEGPWTEEYLPSKTLLHTLMLYKRPPLSNSFIKKVVGKDDYLEALRKLKLLSEEKVKAIESSGSILVDKIKIIVEGVIESTRNNIVHQLKGYLILGGHETIGKGIVKLEIFNAQNLMEAFGKKEGS